VRTRRGMAIRCVVAARALSVLVVASGCAPSSVIGPLQHEHDERDKLLARAKSSGVSDDLINTVAPPMTVEEEKAMFKETGSCRTSYMWKNGLTWTGSIFVAAAGGITVGGAYASAISDTANKVLLGVSVGSLAALGSALVAVGGIVQSGFTDRGCWVR
jgi:hypothetical protein